MSVNTRDTNQPPWEYRSGAIFFTCSCTMLMHRGHNVYTAPNVLLKFYPIVNCLP